MKNKLDFHKEITYIKNNNEGQVTPYISISNSKSDSSNLQIESSHFSLKSNCNKNNSSSINNQQIFTTNNNNIFLSSTSGFLSLSKSIINTITINNSHNNNNSSVQISSENLSLSGSNKLQISSNSNIFKKNDTSTISTICNYYQQSNDVTPYKSPLIKEGRGEPSSGKELLKLKQINIDFITKKKNNNINNNNNNFCNNNCLCINNKNNNNLGGQNIINNIGEISSRSDECDADFSKTLSSHRKYVFDKKTPIKYAKNQMQSGEKNQSCKSNNSKLENNNSSISDNKSNNQDEKSYNKKKNRMVPMIETKNGRNLMDTFDKVGNCENLKIFNNRRQPTEIHLTSAEFQGKISDNNNNLNQKIIDKLENDSSFLEKDISDNVKLISDEDRKIEINDKLTKIKKIPDRRDSCVEKNNKDWKKIIIRKIIPVTKKEDGLNTTELSKKIIKELSRANLEKRKESRPKLRPSSFTKNIIINFNSFNSIGLNNNINNNNNTNNTNNTNNSNNNNLITTDKNFHNHNIFNTKISIKNNFGKLGINNNTIEPSQTKKKKIPIHLEKKEKNILNKEVKQTPESEIYNRRAASFCNVNQNNSTNLFLGNNTNYNFHNPKSKSNSITNTKQKINTSKTSIKKPIPLILNLFVEEDKRSHSKKLKKNISKDSIINGHKIIKNKLIPLVNNSKNENNTIISNSLINNVKELKELSNTRGNSNSLENCDKNYQTVSALPRTGLKYKDKKKFEDLIKKNEIREHNNCNSNNIILNPNYNIQSRISIQKEEPKLQVIQNFSSYHKIKYKSHLSENINFAETQPKKNSKMNSGFYNYNKNTICNRKKKNIYSCNNVSCNLQQHNNSNSGNIIYENKNISMTKQVKFRKLERLPGDSDSGEAELNGE